MEWLSRAKEKAVRVRTHGKRADEVQSKNITRMWNARSTQSKETIYKSIRSKRAQLEDYSFHAACGCLNWCCCQSTVSSHIPWCQPESRRRSWNVLTRVTIPTGIVIGCHLIETLQAFLGVHAFITLLVNAGQRANQEPVPVEFCSWK